MLYSDIQTAVQTKLNRRDVTPTMITQAISLGIQRAQRLMRVPASEQTVTYAWQTADTKFAIPGDYLKMVTISVDGGDPLDRRALREVRRWAFAVSNPGSLPLPINGISKMYARDGAFFVIAPMPAPGAIVTLTYNANFANLVLPTDTNWLADIAPDVIIYGALSDLGLTYADPRRSDGAWGKGWESTFVTAIEDLNNQASEDELTNSQVEPTYHYADGPYSEEW